ncbi:biphenyl 2,3-dioxygenase [Salipaludibacillus neizhouensis]|uniref:Biphenyl 2,3-dioxygenase n=1 Tax=Salipaludibacillus neizhouensis TaxID=885475 RepID=A0A3A9KFQ1_9BACI|nr:STAS domain-containing protein [Salipaludibacillus neizhouensis]RKL66445.1 biphenyl 2,3-dioxygenase [Salipaludibacillus neizhouensis]
MTSIQQLKNKVLEKTHLVFIISDPDQQDNPIIYANQGFTALTGYSQEEVIGKNCRFLQGDGTNQQTLNELKEAINRKEPISVEILNYKKNGESFWNLLHIDPIYFEDEDKHFFVGIQKDITPLKETEMQMEKIKKEIELLSTPIVPIQDDVAILPLIGNIDERRIDNIVDQLLPQLAKGDIEVLIVDLSGLATLNEHSMIGLFQLSDLLQLKGVKLIISGITPKIAMMAKNLNYDLSSLATCGTVKQGLETIERSKKAKLAKS